MCPSLEESVREIAFSPDFPGAPKQNRPIHILWKKLSFLLSG